MMRIWRWASVLVGAGVLATWIGAQTPGQTQNTAESELERVQALVAKAQITLAQAVETAAKEVKDGKAYRAELRTVGEQALYEVTLLAGEQQVEVKIDAASGNVLGIEREALETTAGRRWNFDKDAVGALPPGWVAKQNNPTKALAKWTVEADESGVSQPNILNVHTENANATYNLVLVEKAVYRDVNLMVKIRGNTGQDDQGGGLIWRCKDENNYYVCRINPLESNYRVYKVVAGKRIQLATADFETPTGQWFTLRVRMKGDQITCYCDGKKWLEVKDDTFKDAGMIGLWTKADASSSFDNLRAWPISSDAEGR